MDVAIIGAAGTCGRQLTAQLLDRRVLPANGRLQLVGHQGGPSADELWGLRADLQDAFVDDAPAIELALDPSEIDASLVVMLAGSTLSTDPNAPLDRAGLGRANHRMFADCAAALARRPGPPPTVIVQSNPVELGVQAFARRLGRQRVLGAGAWSDTLRWRGEIAAELGVRRPQVRAFMIGQHGDGLVPVWSQIQVRGVAAADVNALVARSCAGRIPADFPREIREGKARVLEMIRSGRVHDAYDLVQAMPVDLRAAVKPFFTHFTAGRTTEMVTAHAVADILAALLAGDEKVIPAQVMLEGEWLGLHGVVGVPVLLGLEGWAGVAPLALSDGEATGLQAAAQAIAAANAACASPQ
jgi:malate dehydrogenase